MIHPPCPLFCLASFPFVVVLNPNHVVQFRPVDKVVVGAIGHLPLAWATLRQAAKSQNFAGIERELEREGALRDLLVANGKESLADTYNLANITPNIVYELLVGGVLAATLVPVFVGLLERRDDRSMSAVFTWPQRSSRSA